MRTVAGIVSRHALAYGIALAAVLLLVVMTPALDSPSNVALFGTGVGGLAVLPWVLLQRDRRTVLLGVAAFVVPFSVVDKWFLYRPHLGGAPGIEVSVADLLLVVLYAVWFWESLTSSQVEGRSRTAVNGVLVAALAFVTLVSLSIVNATSIPLVAFELVQISKLLLWLVYLGWNVRRVAHLRALAVGTACAVVVHSLFAFAQKLAGGAFGLTALGEAEGQAVGLFAGQYTRVGGLTGSPVLLGAFFAVSLPFVLAAVSTSTRMWSRVASVGVVLVGAAGLAVTMSRGAGVAWLFGLIWFVVWMVALGRLNAATRAIFGGLAVALIAIAAVALPVIYNRFLFSDPGSIEARMSLLDIAMRIISAHPVAGIGLNNWAEVMAGYDTSGISAVTTAPVHNIYLLVWAETGILGLAGFATLVITLLVTAYRAMREASAIEVQVAALAAGTSVLAMLLKGMASLDLRFAPEHQLFWCIAGLVVAVRRMSLETSSQPHGRVSPYGP